MDRPVYAGASLTCINVGKKIGCPVDKGHFLWLPVQLLLDLPYSVEHLFRVRREPVAEVVLDLPEPDLLIVVPDNVADEDVTGNRKGDDHGKGEPKMDVKEVLEQLGVCRDDTKVYENLSPRCPPGVPLLE